MLTLSLGNIGLTYWSIVRIELKTCMNAIQKLVKCCLFTNKLVHQLLRGKTSCLERGSTGNSAQCYVAAWMGGDFGGEWIHVYVWLSPFAVHLKLSQHC